MRNAIAVTQEQRVRPAYSVQELTGTVSREIHMWDDSDHKIKKKKIDVPAGYFVKFAKGHSQRMSEAELERLTNGDPSIALVDIETGEVVGKVAA